MSLYLMHWQEHSTLIFHSFAVCMERHYYLSKHVNRKFSQGSHVQGQGWPLAPCLFSSALRERGICTSCHGNGLLSPAWQIEPGTVFSLKPNNFYTNVYMENLLETIVCSGHFLSHNFYFSNTMINALQRGWIIVQSHLFVVTELSWSELTTAVFSMLSWFYHRVSHVAVHIQYRKRNENRTEEKTLWLSGIVSESAWTILLNSLNLNPS